MFNNHLGARVEVARCLVQHEDCRVNEGRTGERHQLSLPCRQARATFADFSVDAFFELLEPVECANGIERCSHIVIRGVGPGNSDVVGNRASEQEPLLGNNNDTLAQRANRGITKVDTAEGDGACSRIVEPRHQLGERRLARSGRADHGQSFAICDGNRDIVEHQ